MMSDYKKVTAFAPLIATIILGGCMAITVVNYVAPTYEIKAGEIKAADDNKQEENNVIAVGNFDLADGVYRGVGTGFAGKITVSVEIKDKTITAINVLEVEADDAAFFNRAKGVIDKIIASQSLDVDVVSGATYSSNGIISAVKNALTGESDDNTVAKTNSSSKSTVLDKVDDPKAYRDGTYYGTGTGFGGKITVQVDISGGKIADIKITDHSDGASYIQKAQVIITNVIATQSTNVDTVSGATYSSVGIIEAIRNALSQAAVQGTTTVDTNQNNNSNSDVSAPAGTIPYNDGVYYGSGEGYMGDISVALVLQDHTIKAILITDVEADDESFVERAKAVITNVIKQQNTDVDVVSGATFSSNGILEAINNALNEAKEATYGKPDTPSEPEEPIIPDNPNEDVLYNDGEYTAQALCNPDEDEDFEAYTISLKIIIKDGKIAAVTDIQGYGDGYLDDNDSYINRAVNGTSRLPGVVAQIIEKNGTDNIDIVSRATCSSKSIIEACTQALENAKRKAEIEN